jgi:hypothetical protein
MTRPAPTPEEFTLLRRARDEGGLVNYAWGDRSGSDHGWTTDALRRSTPHGERPVWRARVAMLERAKGRGWLAQEGARARVTAKGRAVLAEHEATAATVASE